MYSLFIQPLAVKRMVLASIKKPKAILNTANGAAEVDWAI